MLTRRAMLVSLAALATTGCGTPLRIVTAPFTIKHAPVAIQATVFDGAGVGGQIGSGPSFPVVLSWDPPTGGGPVETYTVTLDGTAVPSGTDLTPAPSGGTTSFTFTGVPVGPHVFGVFARNSFAAGPPATLSLNVNPPNAPTNVKGKKG
jgi:hypothetical protein